jgi:hypothetical protein
VAGEDFLEMRGRAEAFGEIFRQVQPVLQSTQFDGRDGELARKSAALIKREFGAAERGERPSAIVAVRMWRMYSSVGRVLYDYRGAASCRFQDV